MDIDWTIITHNPFFWGLAIGFVLCVVIIVKAFFRLRSLRKEKDLRVRELQTDLSKLKQHLQTQLEIEAESKQNVKRDVEELKKQNENLRVTVQTLRQKPKREDILLLHTYDHALKLMRERAPGFASSWENAMREAQEEVKRMETGMLPFIKKVFAPSAWLSSKPEAKQIESSDD